MCCKLETILLEICSSLSALTHFKKPNVTYVTPSPIKNQLVPYLCTGTHSPNTNTGIIDAQLLQGGLQIFVLVGVEGVEACEDHRLGRRDLQQGRHRPVLGQCSLHTGCILL